MAVTAEWRRPPARLPFVTPTGRITKIEHFMDRTSDRRSIKVTPYHAMHLTVVCTLARVAACLATVVCSSVLAYQLVAQKPGGLAASALADTSFTWIPRTIPGFRVYFAADSYPAAHQDSLLERLPAALARARTLIDSPAPDAPIDLFFIESRTQMTALIRGRATGFAEPSTRTVILVTNPAWRAFERHEIMHVVAQHAWGAPVPGNDWLVEGLAQAADGMCAGYSNADAMLALTTRHGWIPFDTMLDRFREQPDGRAYLQAAAFVEHLLQRYGAEPVAALWRNGAHARSLIDGETLATIEVRWRDALRATRQVTEAALARIDAEGCG